MSFERHRSYEIKVSGTGGVLLIVGAAAKDGVTSVRDAFQCCIGRLVSNSMKWENVLLSMVRGRAYVEVSKPVATKQDLVFGSCI